MKELPVIKGPFGALSDSPAYECRVPSAWFLLRLPALRPVRLDSVRNQG